MHFRARKLNRQKLQIDYFQIKMFSNDVGQRISTSSMIICHISVQPLSIVTRFEWENHCFLGCCDQKNFTLDWPSV